MSISDFHPDDRFVIRVLKHHVNNPERKWANNYELVARDAGAETEMLAAATQIVDFEIALHYDVVIFDEVTASTWEPDSKPYNPDTFLSSPLTATGDVSIGTGELAAANVCLNVRKQVAKGRFGHNFYRCALLEADISAPAGTWVLTNPGGIQERIDTAVTSSTIDDLFEGGRGALLMAIITNDVIVPRTVLSLHVGGVSTVPLNHAWFNRPKVSPAP